MKKTIPCFLERGVLFNFISRIFLTVVLLNVLQATSFAQTTTEVTGTVLDEKNEPLYGVIVSLKDGSGGTSTDENGKFTIAVKDMSNGVLQFQFTGYETRVMPIKNQKVIDVKMGEDVKMMDEQIVIGYGSKIKPKVTESISSVDEKEMKLTVNPSLESALQGRVTGVQVLQNSGQPGSPASVRIRGIGSTNGGEPLYVIDGVPVNQDALNLLNPGDIERMDVLKDASAAAIYGSRGANGVVIITTKRGKEGKPRISMDASTGWQQVWRKLDLLETPGYLSLAREAYGSDTVTLPGAYGEASGNPYQNINTNWQDAIFRKPSQATIQNYNLGISGGNEFATYNVSGGYFNQVGTLVGTDFKRYSLRVNTDLKAKKWLRLGESVSLSRADESPKLIDINEGVRVTPMLPVNEKPDVNANNVGAYNRDNPVLYNNSRNHNSQTYRILGNIYAEVEPIKALKYRLNLGLDLINTRRKNINEAYNPLGGSGSNTLTPLRNITDERDYRISPLMEHTLSYNKVFGEKHDLGALIGFTQQDYLRSNISTFNVGIPDNLSIVNYASTGRVAGGDDDWWALRGYIGRLNYSFANKYLLTANVRVDGSSKFGRNNRYGTFPSLSVGWRLMEEKFLKDIPFMAAVFNDIKIRAGYGKIGAQEMLTTGRTQATMNDKVAYILGGKRIAGLGPEGLANPNLKWETVITKNVGLDVSILKNKISLMVDYFIKDSEGMLIDIPIPQLNGASKESEIPADRLWTNAGNMRNRGYELALTYREDVTRLKYSLTANFSRVHNEILSLGTDAAPILGTEGRTYTYIGGPVGAFYGYKTDGIFQNRAEIDNYAAQNPNGDKRLTNPGDVRFVDINGDGIVTEKDRTIIGTSIPKFTYGLTGSFEYGIVDFRFFFQGVYGNQIYNLQRQGLEDLRGFTNQLASVEERWTPSNPSTTMPRATLNDLNKNNRLSDRWIESGSYLRLKNIQVGVSIPKNVIKNVIKTEDDVLFRVYGSINNALTFTKYKGYDPEVGSALTAPPANSPDPLNTGVDLGNYPQARIYTIGLQLTF
ncbi:MAG TPA: TonB-dependent receptor [Cytophagaceae bacterium]|jgi:TonB-linked SusC/RagA family outer membrane protein